jgi:hypothetical protein
MASLVGLAAALLAAGPAPVPRLHADGLEPVVRTVYVTVTNGQGAKSTGTVTVPSVR